MRVFSSMEKPSMAPMWRKMREIRDLVTKHQPKDVQRFSASNWRKNSTQDAAKRFSSATSYLAAVSVKAHRRSSITRFSFISQLEKATEIGEFELLDVLGRGTFGTVQLARHLDTGATVAIKVLKRQLVHEMKQEKNILREQSVHLGLLHPFVARLYATFQDNDALYFVLEFCPGGEIYSLVYTHDDGHLEESEEDSEEERPRPVEDEPEVSDAVTTESESEEENRPRRVSLALGRNSLTLENFLFKQKLRSSYGGLHERYVAFYAACLVSALEFLHKRGVLYRDLKLENLVLDAEGYPKLIDFGLSKPDATRTSERTSTMCGSAEYMAPEIVQHKPYDQRVDLWAFGILLYEMLFGATPFYHSNHREQGRRIISEPVEFPEDYEQGHPAVCSLVRKLLEKDPALRLASFGEVKKTTFFLSYFPSTQGWQQLEARQVEPPFVPRLDGPFDTSLFVRVQDDEEKDYGSDADSDFGY
ncbi:AGC protein kinase [Phytophthora megakarya]|uniref:AGC protein kinase n=1 Tax=Phytophthora megakarya TaxID=4795 RepID=A0A225VM14_9STRA|nr:AGC protein kinase [Phytophthora megakarya]